MKRGYLPELGAAIRNGDLHQVKLLLADNPNYLDVETPFGSWLDFAAREGRQDIASYLLERGLDVNRVNHHGETPICRAAYSGNSDLVAFLLKCGANVSTTGPNAVENPMFGAISSGSTEIAQLLLAHGLDASIDYGNGKTVASFALLRGVPEIADLIAESLAHGDPTKKATIIEDARSNAERQGKGHQARILPSQGDLEE